MADEAVVLVAEVGRGGGQRAQRGPGLGAEGNRGDAGGVRHQVAPRGAPPEVAAVDRRQRREGGAVPPPRRTLLLAPYQGDGAREPLGVEHRLAAPPQGVEPGGGEGRGANG